MTVTNLSVTEPKTTAITVVGLSRTHPRQHRYSTHRIALLDTWTSALRKAYSPIQALSAEDEWEVVIDDDGPGELADIVLLKRTEDALEVLIAHCKYSSGDKPGARIDDLYDVCGQAMKMNRAKAIPELLTKRLFRREKQRQSSGKTGLIAGEIATLASIVREARYRTLNVSVAIVQPGMSKSLASEDMRALLGGTERFLVETHGMRLRVIANS